MGAVLVTTIDGDLSNGPATAQEEMPTMFHPEAGKMLNWRLTPVRVGSPQKLVLADAGDLCQPAKRVWFAQVGPHVSVHLP